MQRFRRLALSAAVVLAATACEEGYISKASNDASAPAKKSDLRILYVGVHPDKIRTRGEVAREFSVTAPTAEELETDRVERSFMAARTSNFDRFLSKNFMHVDVVFSHEFDEVMSENYDVTIFGNAPRRNSELTDQNDNKWPVYLSADYDHAAILFDKTSPVVALAHNYKMDWLCLCLEAYAHNVKTDHPIFTSPKRVNLTFEDRDTPTHYRSVYNYSGRDLPDTTEMWRVQTKGYLSDPGFPIGMVSSGFGFDNAPDGEIISSGVNSKNVQAVALGRHGNFFHWGFAADPEYMTEEARQVFLNAIHYISEFKGKKPYSKRRPGQRSRYQALNDGTTLENASYDAYVQDELSRFEQYQAYLANVLAKGGELTFQQRRVLSKTGPDLVAEDAWLSEVALVNMPKRLVEEFGGALDLYLPYYEENLEVLEKIIKEGPGVRAPQFLADDDAIALGYSNRDPEILDAAISVLEADEGNAQARRVLQRYTDQEFDTAAQWRSWYEERKGRFYFADIDGYIFHTIPEGRLP